jgi:hypothetical protein
MMVAALLAGCGSLQARQRLSSLDDSLNAYRLLLRWSHFDEAQAYTRPQPGKELVPAAELIDPEKLKSIRLASYDIVNKIVTPDEKEAAITVAMTYYDEESNVLHTLKQVQHWWYSEDQKRWFLQDPLPDFIGDMRNRN